MARGAAQDEALTNAPGGEAPAAAAGFDPAEAFSRLSRAIRLTVTLEGKADQELRDIDEGVHRQFAEESGKVFEQIRKSEKEALDWRRSSIAISVMEAAESDPAELSDKERSDVDSLLDEWLDNHESYWADKDRPMGDVVDRLCRWFRLSPDWGLWVGEGWSEPDTPRDPWPWEIRAGVPAKTQSPEARPPGRSAPRGLNGASPPDLE